MGCAHFCFKLIAMPFAFVQLCFLLCLWIVGLIVFVPISTILSCICCRKPSVREPPPTADAVKPLGDEDESEFSVAIVGAGWTGLQCAQQLIARGVKVRVFERMDDLGGTWHPNMSYDGLQLHSPLYINEIEGFPHPDHSTRTFEKLDAWEMREYLHDFAKAFHLNDVITFDAEVTRINHDTATNTATVTYQHSKGEAGGTTICHPQSFDLVVLALFASVPTIPNFPGTDQFLGRIMHSADMKFGEVERLCEEEKRVVVVGGNKSASDMMLLFARAGYDKMTWIYRQQYLFTTYEGLMAHKASPIGFLRGFVSASAFSASMFLPCTTAAFLRLVGYFRTPFDGHFNLSRYHLGILDQKQFDMLESIAPKSIRANPVKLTSNSVITSKGQEVPADVIVCATGYLTGLDNITFSHDGSDFEIPSDEPLYEHLLIPSMSCVAIAAAMYTFGPKRGVSLADHVWRVLHKRPSGREELLKSAKGNWAFSSATQSTLFTSDRPFLAQWVLLYLDFVRTGVMGLWSVLIHVLKIVAWNEQPVLRLKEP